MPGGHPSEDENGVPSLVQELGGWQGTIPPGRAAGVPWRRGCPAEARWLGHSGNHPEKATERRSNAAS